MSLSEVEVTSLRSELVNHSNQILNVTKIAVTAATAIIGFGLTRPTPQSAIIALLPLLILWPSFTIIRNRRMNILRIATYLRAFSGEVFQYETRLRKLRKRKEQVRWPSFHLSIARTFLVLGYVSVAVSTLVLIIDKQWCYLIVPVFGCCLWTVFTAKVKKSDPDILMGSKADDEMFEAWGETDSGSSETRVGQAAAGTKP